MRIIYYSRPSFGDCDLPLIKSLINKGHEVYVIYAMSPWGLKTTIFNIDKVYPQSGLLPASIYHEVKQFSNYVPLDHFYFANDSKGRISWGSIKASLQTLWYFYKMKPDVINYVETPSKVHFLFLWLFKKKLVLTVHDGKPHSGEANKSEESRRKLSFKYIKRFILLNKKEKDVFCKEYNVPKERAYVSHLGYYDILHMYGNPQTSKKKQILFFGRISQYKGVEYLLEAMKKVHQEHPEYNLVVAGGGKYYFDISEYERLDYIEIRNRYITLDELSDLIRESAFTVCPYTDATQSGVVFSSFALNTPAIVTNVGGLPEMVEHRKTGLVVPPKDSESLAKAMIELINNPVELNAMSENITESANHGVGSWDEIANDYLNVYKKK